MDDVAKRRRTAGVPAVVENFIDMVMKGEVGSIPMHVIYIYI